MANGRKEKLSEENSSDISQFELKLKQAVENEQYEEAARIRDILQNLQSESQW